MTDLALEMVEPVAPQAVTAIEGARVQARIDNLAATINQHPSQKPLWAELRGSGANP